MANLASVLENFFTIASETFTDNLSASISAGATTVPVNNASEYAEGDVVVLTVDPGTANEATFLGVKDTGNQFINCKWTEGNTAVGHDSGATIIDYDSATHHNAQTKGILEFADQQGNLLTQAVRDALNLGTESVNGWEVLPYTVQVASGYNKGNRSFEVTIPNNDVTSQYSKGMRLRMERNTAAPTQCADLESGSSQYASKSSPSGISFTDDFTIEAWVNLESYTGSQQTIASRYGGGTGFLMVVNFYGQVEIFAQGAATRQGQSTQSLPLGKWVHVAGTLDMSGNVSTIYFDGVSVPVTMNGAGTSLTQAGNLQVGAYGSGQFFDGKISDVRIWSTVRTASQIRDNMNQQLVGNETNLVAYFKLNGDFNDSTSNANHLTGSGGVVATNLDNPFLNNIYAVITDVTYSAPNTILTVFCPEGNGVPNMQLNAPYYSINDSPYGFPCEKTLWEVESILASDLTKSGLGTTTFYATDYRLTVPKGAWGVGYNVSITAGGSMGATAVRSHTVLSENTTDFASSAFPTKYGRLASSDYFYPVSSAVQSGGNLTAEMPLSITSPTTLALSTMVAEGAGTVQFTYRGGPNWGGAQNRIYARCAYV